jgi:hypothetical protein
MPPQNHPAGPQAAPPQPGVPCPLPGHQDPKWSHVWPTTGPGPIAGGPAPRECHGTVPPDHGTGRGPVDPAAGAGPTELGPTGVELLAVRPPTRRPAARRG